MVPASRQRVPPLWCVVVSLAALSLAAPLGGCGADRPTSPGSSSHGSTAERLVLEHSGLLANHQLTVPGASSTVPPDFRLGGTAALADRRLQIDASGLHVAIGAHRGWRGFYAATSATYPADSVFRVQMSRPNVPVRSADGSGIALLAIQTAASPLLNYVLVANVVSRKGTFWIVGYAVGDTAYANTRVLWASNGGPATEDITLQTDGRSRLTVLFGRRVVYRSHTLSLRATPPLRAYLEVEARHVAYSSSFRNFQVVQTNGITVGGLRPGSQVKLTPDRAAAVSARADGDGRAKVVLPLSDPVGRGGLTIDGAGATQRFRVAFAGGDVFRLRP